MPVEGVSPLKPIDKPNLLLVEGRDDQILFSKLLEHMGRAEEVSVRSYGGTSGLRGYLDPLRIADGFETIISIVIVRDADQDCAAALQSIQDALGHYGFQYPQKPLAFSDSSPRFGIVIMPCGNQTGALEDVCLEAVGDDPALPCAQQYLDCLDSVATTQTLKLCSNRSKILVNAFLASRPDPSLKIGEAAGAGIWNWDHEAWQSIVTFIEQI